MSSGQAEPAFLAVSALLGEPLEQSVAAMGDAGAVNAADLLAALRSSSRQARARAIARALSEIALDLEAMQLGAGAGMA
jgi:hypothetical protein